MMILCPCFEPITIEEYNLWERFCNQTDTYDDTHFSRVVAVIQQQISVDYLLLLEQSIGRQSRKALVRKLLETRNFVGLDETHLTQLESAIYRSTAIGQIGLATEILQVANSILDRPPFTNKNNFFIERKNTWKTIDYKVNLLRVFSDNSLPTEEKIKHGHSIENPFENAKPYHQVHQQAKVECEQFLQYITAIENYQHKPELSAVELFRLCFETKNNIKIYVRQWFAAKLRCLDKNEHSVNQDYRHLLSDYLNMEGELKIDQLDVPYLQNLIDCYRRIKAYKKIESIWGQSSIVQRRNIRVAMSYCHALRDQGDYLKARKILDQLTLFHKQDLNDPTISALLKELNDLIVDDVTVASAIKLSASFANERQSTNALRATFEQIKSRALPEQLKIFSEDSLNVEQFLTEQLVCICRELMLRKGNLSMTSSTSNSMTSYRITKEDLINDWFTSLFEQRFSCFPKMSCRDQKRGGFSPTMKGPGQVDFYLYNHNNERIAIIEAFRLFSLDQAVISEHLNKIASYNTEGLSPVFILIYSQINNFSRLSNSYLTNISKRQYHGFDRIDEDNHQVNMIETDSSLVLFQETRTISGRQISFYHYLLNFN